MSSVPSEVSKYMGNAVKLADIWGSIIYNVKAYGAKGDGSDDSSAVLAAITAANGGPVEFPPGTYNLVGMSGVGGRVNLVSLFGAVIKGFYYKELNSPSQSISATTAETDAYFTATNLTFEGVGTTPGLKIENQSQGTFIKSFDLHRCTFRGQIGLETKNCLDSNIHDCAFIHNQYGWKALSNTNITVTDARFFSPTGYGVYINQSDTDTFNRFGGESIKFTSCQWFDGATAIQCINHNYMIIDNCMIDYFNMGVYLKGSRFTKIVSGTYIGHTAGSRYSGPLGITPTKLGCLYAEGDQARSFTSGVEISHVKFAGYSDAAADLVFLDGSITTFNGIENTSITNTQFHMVGTTPTTKYHLNVKNAQDIIHSGNRYYAPNNDNLLAPWLFTTMTRLISQNNNFTNCFKSTSANIPPASGAVGNQIMEAATLTVTGNGTSTTGTAQYTYVNKYTGVPKIVVTANSGGTYGTNVSKINVGVIAKDSSTSFVEACHIDGTVIPNGNTIIIDVFVIGTPG
ncbi:hypothetical protein A8709_33015 [Paenibacillus pectinilyticus]|uniref:Uncharacterized protein n=1 Tax=Paenibacillus pectinilyticus TaxID=512399 RepID=A0A1C0ZWY9_9BACL|nr:glycosyl hydrolase family 28-related protein [Paenibacillus pectinilyticus]OCT12633.1 hypothetical protein A8709_33015 [Paenibacillus pectinilyticus]